MNDIFCSLMEVDISHNKLSFVPSSLFKMPELLVLNLSFNLLRTLPGDPEDPSAATPGGMVEMVILFILATCMFFRSVISSGIVGSSRGWIYLTTVSISYLTCLITFSV